MDSQSTIVIPPDLSDPAELRRILIRIIERLDELEGNRGAK